MHVSNRVHSATSFVAIGCGWVHVMLGCVAALVEGRLHTCLNGEGHCSATCFEVWETPGGEKTRSHAAGNLHGSSLLYEVTREGFEPPTQ